MDISKSASSGARLDKAKNSSPFGTTDAAFAVIVVSGDTPKFLLLRSNDLGDQVWKLPGGTLEIGESHQNALRRELREELNLGIGAVPISLVRREYQRYEGNEISYSPVLVRRAFEPELSWEHDRHKWVMTDDIVNHKIDTALQVQEFIIVVRSLVVFALSGLGGSLG